jgi:acetyl-CoA carboxylase biotin carboxylase subunit
VIEEAPSTVLDETTRAKLGKRVTDALAKLGYRNAGTIEFLYQDGELYFIEMNTRLQVEHPVTEMITGIDIVRAQIEIAAGEPLRLTQGDVRFDGHAIECRINAEDPRTLLPTPGRVEAYHAPAGPGVRVDSALYAGAIVPPYYDSLIGKLIVHDRSRAACLSRLRRALGEYVIAGLPSSLPLLQAVIKDPAFLSGDYHIDWLAGFLRDWQG